MLDNLNYRNYQLTTLPIRNQLVKIEIIEMGTFSRSGTSKKLLNIQSNKILADITGVAVSGSVSFDANSSMRRSCNLTMIVANDNYKVSAKKYIWMNKKIKIYLGIGDSVNGEVIWNVMGEFLVNNPSYSFDSSKKTLSISGADLMNYLTESRGGVLEGVEYVIEENSSIKEALISFLYQFGIDKYIIEENQKNTTTPYEIKMNSGSQAIDLIEKLTEIEPYHEYFFDNNGVFVYQKIAVNDNDAAVINDVILDKTLTGESVQYNFDKIKNVIEVIGKAHEPSYFVPNNSVKLNLGKQDSGDASDIWDAYAAAQYLSGTRLKWSHDLGVLEYLYIKKITDDLNTSYPYVVIKDIFLEYATLSSISKTTGSCYYVIDEGLVYYYDGSSLIKIVKYMAPEERLTLSGETIMLSMNEDWIDVTNTYDLTLVDYQTAAFKGDGSKLIFESIPVSATNISVSVTNSAIDYSGRYSIETTKKTYNAVLKNDTAEVEVTYPNFFATRIEKLTSDTYYLHGNARGKKLASSNKLINGNYFLTKENGYAYNVGDYIYDFKIYLKRELSGNYTYDTSLIYFEDGEYLSIDYSNDYSECYIGYHVLIKAIVFDIGYAPPTAGENDSDNIVVTYYDNKAQTDLSYTFGAAIPTAVITNTGSFTVQEPDYYVMRQGFGTTDGVYVFTYNASTGYWSLDDVGTINLFTYGLTVTGTVVDEDKISVSYSVQDPETEVYFDYSVSKITNIDIIRNGSIIFSESFDGEGAFINYTLTYGDTSWLDGSQEISLSEYGLSLSGTPSLNDTITVGTDLTFEGTTVETTVSGGTASVANWDTFREKCRSSAMAKVFPYFCTFNLNKNTMLLKNIFLAQNEEQIRNNIPSSYLVCQNAESGDYYWYSTGYNKWIRDHEGTLVIPSQTGLYYRNINTNEVFKSIFDTNFDVIWDSRGYDLNYYYFKDGDSIEITYDYFSSFKYIPPGEKIGFVTPAYQGAPIANAKVSINGESSLALKTQDNENATIPVHDVSEDNIYGNYFMISNKSTVLFSAGVYSSEYEFLYPTDNRFRYAASFLKDWVPNKLITITSPYLSIITSDNSATKYLIKTTENDGYEWVEQETLASPFTYDLSSIESLPVPKISGEKIRKKANSEMEFFETSGAIFEGATSKDICPILYYDAKTKEDGFAIKVPVSAGDMWTTIFIYDSGSGTYIDPGYDTGWGTTLYLNELILRFGITYLDLTPQQWSTMTTAEDWLTSPNSPVPGEFSPCQIICVQVEDSSARLDADVTENIMGGVRSKKYFWAIVGASFEYYSVKYDYKYYLSVLGGSYQVPAVGEDVFVQLDTSTSPSQLTLIENIGGNDYEEINITKKDGFNLYTSKSALTDGAYYKFKMPLVNKYPKIYIGSFNPVTIVDTSRNEGIYIDAPYPLNFANAYYSFYTNSALQFLGNQQPKGIILDEDPASPFNVETNGEMRAVFSGGEYDNITTSELARDRASYELWVATRLNDSLSLQSIPIYWADVNMKISHPSLRVSEDYYYREVANQAALQSLTGVVLGDKYYVIEDKQIFVCYSIDDLGNTEWRIAKNEYIVKGLNFSLESGGETSISSIKFYEEYEFNRLNAPFLYLKGDDLIWNVDDPGEKSCNIFLIVNGNYYNIESIPANEGSYYVGATNSKIQYILGGYPQVTSYYYAITVSYDEDSDWSPSFYSNFVLYSTEEESLTQELVFPVQGKTYTMEAGDTIKIRYSNSESAYIRWLSDEEFVPNKAYYVGDRVKYYDWSLGCYRYFSCIVNTASSTPLNSYFSEYVGLRYFIFDGQTLTLQSNWVGTTGNFVPMSTGASLEDYESNSKFFYIRPVPSLSSLKLKFLDKNFPR